MFLSINALWKHLDLFHQGRGTYICTRCGKDFIDSSTLKDHERTHTGERPYSCTICDKRFKSNSNLKDHERTHSMV